MFGFLDDDAGCIAEFPSQGADANADGSVVLVNAQNVLEEVLLTRHAPVSLPLFYPGSWCLATDSPDLYSSTKSVSERPFISSVGPVDFESSRNQLTAMKRRKGF